MTLLTVDSIELPNPSKYDIQYADLDSENSFTSETGVLNRDMVRGNQVTLQVGWDRLGYTDLQKILQAVSAYSTQKAAISVTYWDYYIGDYRTMTAYAYNRQATGIRVRPINGRFSLSFNIIEY